MKDGNLRRKKREIFISMSGSYRSGDSSQVTGEISGKFVLTTVRSSFTSFSQRTRLALIMIRKVRLMDKRDI